MRRLLVLCVALAVLAGCGDRVVVREPDLDAGGTATTPVRQSASTDPDGLRIAVVTHGQASSQFWAIVRNGIEAAGRQVDVNITYRSPDVFSVGRMRELIDEAVASKPDALVVSLPSPQLAGSIKRAVAEGIPVVSINSGADLFRRLGILAHVGQQEDDAGAAAGRRLAGMGARAGLCLMHEEGNVGLEERCRAFGRAMRAAGGTARVVSVDVQDPGEPRDLAAIVRRDRADSILALNGDGAVVAVKGAPEFGRKVTIGSFDLNPDVLKAVRSGVITFAIDQQAYLQGYLPVVLLAQKLRYGLFPAQGEVIPTGPSFVTKESAGQALRLSARSIR